MRFALCQINPTVGDVEGNTRRISARYDELRTLADAVVFGELSVPGYPPTDEVFRSEFRDRCARANALLIERSAGARAALIFGTILPADDGSTVRWANAAVVARDGRCVASARKALLPTYDVFDEARFFAARAGGPCVVEIGGLPIGVGICEDFWAVRDPGDFRFYPDPRAPSVSRDVAAELHEAGARLLVNLSASPWHQGKVAERAELVAGASRRTGLFQLYVNLVGGNDDLLFDGRTLCWDGEGREIARAAAWSEDLLLLDVNDQGVALAVDPSAATPEVGEPADELVEALATGLHDFFEKTGSRRAIIGLSGGIDSSVVAALATFVLGPARVLGVAMPSACSSDHSLHDARALAGALGIDLRTVPIEVSVQTLASALEAAKMKPTGVARENLQARIRGDILMTLANQMGALVLTTGNKSELATGYCTLYGDMVGALSVLGDLTKHQVYALGRALGRAIGDPVIPERVYLKPPSAELRPDQTDQDWLPPYDDLDAFLDGYLVQARGAEAAAPRGMDGRRWAALVEGAEFKRAQAAPILRVSAKAFGRGRRQAIARRPDGERGALSPPGRGRTGPPRDSD